MADDAAPPWLAEPEWAAGRLAGGWSARAALGCGGTAVAGGAALAGFALLIVQRDGLRSWPVLWLGLALPLGLWLLAWMLRYRARFRDVALELGSVPWPVGGEAVGALRWRAGTAMAGTLRLALVCLERRSASRGRRDGIELVAWEDVCECEVDVPADAEVVAPVRFAIPADAGPTGDRDRVRRTWVLRASGVAGIRERFAVPVFAAGAADATTRALPAAAGVATPRVPLALAARAALAGIAVEDVPGGRRYVLPRGRRAPGTATLVFVGAVFAAVGAGIASGARVDAAARGIFGYGFGGLGLLLAWLGTARWRVREEIEVAGGGIVAASFGLLRARRRRFAAADVADVFADISYTVGQDAVFRIAVELRERPPGCVSLRRGGGGGAVAGIAHRIADPRLARDLAADLAQALTGG